MWDPYERFTKTVLPNGLTLYHAPWDAPWTIFKFLVRGGSRRDPQGKEGLAHFLEHCVSKNIPGCSCEDLNRLVSSLGAKCNKGMTSFNGTTYRFIVPNELNKPSSLLKTFGDMLIGAEIRIGVEKERQIIRREFFEKFKIKMDEELERKHRRMVFGDCWYSRSASPFGTLESISEINEGDLQDCYDEHYHPGNIAIITVGGMPDDELISLIEGSPFGKEKPGRTVTMPEPIRSFSPPSQTRTEIRFSEFTHVDTSGFSNVRMLSAVPCLFSVRTVGVFTAVMAEIMFRKIRVENGLSYSVSSGFDFLGDFFAVSMHSRSDATALEKIESLMEECLEEASSNKEVLEQEKQEKINSMKLLDLNARSLASDTCDDILYEGRVVRIQECVDEVNGVSIADIRQLAEYFRPQRRLTVVSMP